MRENDEEKQENQVELQQPNIDFTTQNNKRKYLNVFKEYSEPQSDNF